MSGIKRETIIRVILGICMIVVSIGMIYGKSKAGNANGNDRTYIEESENNEAEVTQYTLCYLHINMTAGN